jgi:hypothetical protein
VRELILGLDQKTTGFDNERRLLIWCGSNSVY